MRPVPIIMITCGTAIMVAATPYVMAPNPQTTSAPAPLPAPAPNPDPDSDSGSGSGSASEPEPGPGAAYARDRAAARQPAPTKTRRPGTTTPDRGSAASRGDGVAAAPRRAPAPGPASKPARRPDPPTAPRPGSTSVPTTPSGPVTVVTPRPDDGQRPVAVPKTEGGHPIFARGHSRCLLGFNVRKDGDYYFLTAGGCAEPGLKIYADPALTVELGTVVAVTNGTVGLVKYVEPGVERPGGVRLATGSQDITASRSPDLGQQLCRTSPTTGVHCGTVMALNQSVQFPEGTINGLARTSICAEPGDNPGAPYFSGTTALGLGITGNGGCGDGGTSYFQPLAKVLGAFGVDVY